MAVGPGMRLCGPIERESGSRTRTQVDAVDAPGPAHDLDRVAPDRVADAHPVDLVAQLGDLGGIEDRPERLGADVRRPVDPQNRVLIIGVGVAEIQKKEEPVELRLRQRKGAFELDRVLGRDDQERVRQRVRGLVDGDLALLHRLEQRRLRPRSGAVDLVDEHHVR